MTDETGGDGGRNARLRKKQYPKAHNNNQESGHPDPGVQESEAFWESGHLELRVGHLILRKLKSNISCYPGSKYSRSWGVLRNLDLPS
jgi:hypothetical protein